MDGTPNIPHYPFRQTFVAYPANVVATNDGESVIGSTLSQDSSNGFALPIVSAQTLGSPAPDGSSMQQIVKINHRNSDTTFVGGPQAQLMVANPSGYTCNTHDLSTNEVNSTRGEALFPGMQNQLGAANPMYALSGNSQPQQAASRLDVHMRTQAIQRLNLTAITQSRSSSQSVLPSNIPMRNLQLDHSWREPAVISSPNTHNLQRCLIRGEGLEPEALSAKLPSLLGDRYSDATVTPSKFDPDSNLVMGKLKSQVQRAVGHVEAVKDANATEGLAAESANGVGIGMEIKEIIERILQYKNMHPTIFSKIWERVTKDQGGQEIEVTGKSNALSNGDRNLNSSISSQNHLGSRSELSIEPSQQGNLDVESETTQRRKRNSSEIISRTSDLRRQRPDVIRATPTPTIPHSFPSNLDHDSMNGYAHNTSLNPAMPSLSDGHHHLNEIQKPPRSLPPSPIDGNTKKRSYTSINDLTSEQSTAIVYGIQTSRVGMEKTDDVNLRRGKTPSLFHADTPSCYGKPAEILDQTANKRMKKSLADDKIKDLSHFEYAKSQQDLLRSNIIITPMDVETALRRSTYNSNSIAKDVLLAAAKHPTEAPLNHHLDVLRRKFIHVSLTSDLSTFRWELVDPGPDEQNVPAARSRIADVDDTEEEDLDPRKSASADFAANDRVVGAANADTTANQNAGGRPPCHEKVMDQRFIGTATQEGPSNTVVPVAYSDKSMTTDKISKPNRQSAQQAPNRSDATSLALKPKCTANASPDQPHSTQALEQKPQALSEGAERFNSSFARPRDVRALSGSRVREAYPVRLEQRVKARLPVSTQNSKPSRSNSLTSRKSYSTPMRPSGLGNFVTPPDGIAVVIQSPPPKTGAVENPSGR